jgi:hypothetical protein
MLTAMTSNDAPPSLGIKVIQLFSNWRFNPVLLAHVHNTNSIPLSHFFEALGCEDECIIAASIRKDTGLELTPDGRSLAETAQSLAEKLSAKTYAGSWAAISERDDPRTIYIEKYTLPITPDHIKRIYPTATYTVISDDSNYAFLMFGSEKEARNILASHSYPSLTSTTDLKEFIKTESSLKKGYRMMAMYPTLI